MAKIRIKRSTGSSAPNSSDLANAELAFAEGNDILYYGEGTSGSNAASVIKIGGSGAFCDLTTAQTLAGDKTFSNNVVVTGNLTVNGSTSTLNTTNSVVKDSLIELGNGTSGTPSNDAGLVIERGSSNNAFIGWDESADKFTIGTGTFTGASTGNLSFTTATLVGNLEGAVTGNASSATALANGRTIGMTGDVSWTSASFDGTGDVTGTATIQTGAVEHAMLAADCIDGDNIQNDVIDSEHYAAGSIDNEHLADDAVGVAELSATGSPSSTTFLRGDNVWATPSTGTATTMTVSDESSDTTCFPLFATAATGDLPPKSGSNLTFNSATGQLDFTVLDGGTF